jgi:hypothetical protein
MAVDQFHSIPFKRQCRLRDDRNFKEYRQRLWGMNPLYPLIFFWARHLQWEKLLHPLMQREGIVTLENSNKKKKKVVVRQN